MPWRPGRRYLSAARMRARMDSGIGSPRNSFVDPPYRLLPPVTAPYRQHFIDLLRRLHTLRRCIDDLRPAVGKVAAGEHARIVLGPRELYALALADRDNHHVTRDCLGAPGRPHLECRYGTLPVADDALRGRVEPEATAIAFRQFVLVVVARHVSFTATVDDRGCGRAEPFGLRHCVDGGVTGADHHDVPSDRRLAIGMRLQMCDEREGIHDAWQVRAGDSQWL